MKLSNCSVFGGLALLSVVVGCGRSAIGRIEWVTMGTVAAVQHRGGGETKVVEKVVRESFARVVEEFNAFDPNSAINRLGKCTTFGQPCWNFAFRLKDETSGAFDPYWKRNGKLDFGAVAKGFAVDLAADEVRKVLTEGTPDILIDLGGNLKAVKGDWTVGIKDGAPFVLKEGEACATSATYYRGEHIIDARTGNAATNGVYSVTVVHPSSAMIADGLSTILYILGREKGELFLRKHHPEARALYIRNEN